jgi:hypothetical protein
MLSISKVTKNSCGVYSMKNTMELQAPSDHIGADLRRMVHLLPLLPKASMSIDEIESLYRPIIDANRHLWPSQEERLRNKNPEPFVME